MTYSLYLVHAPIVMIVTAWCTLKGMTSPALATFIVLPVCVGLALVVSRGFFLLVERHCLNSASAARTAPQPHIGQAAAVE